MSPIIGTSNLQTINGVIPGLDAGGRLETSIYGTDAVPGDQEVHVDALGRLGIASPGVINPVVAHAQTPAASVIEGGVVARTLGVMPFLYNGVTYDVAHNNVGETLLASAVRAATTSSPTMINYNARGVFVFFRVTAVPGADTVTCTIRCYDPVAAIWETLLTGAALAGAGAYLYLLYPGAGAAANDVTVVNAFPLPRQWRVTIAHSAATNFTYSVYSSLIL